MSITNINKGNKALEYIEKRISSDDYRGLHIFQHYRYDIDYIDIVLKELLNYENKTKQPFLRIRTADNKKRTDTQEEYDYAIFVSVIKRKTGKATKDSVRKIIFVDCNRMGFINRFDKNKKLINTFTRSVSQYISLTDKGKKFINAKNNKERYFIFSSALYLLVGDLIKILKILMVDYELDYISKWEFMYFVSAINDNSDISINIELCVELIKEFRLLSEIDKQSVTKFLKNKMVKDKTLKNKKKQRDFNNWKNEADEIFLLLSTTVYFEGRKDEKGSIVKLLINNTDTSIDVIVGGKFVKQRSLQAKNDYYKNHKVSKKNGFELHHIIALEYADNATFYKILDDWKNILYIDAYSHARITQNKNRNIILEAKDNDLSLKDYSNNKVELKDKDNVMYDINKQNILLDYNKKWIKEI